MAVQSNICVPLHPVVQSSNNPDHRAVTDEQVLRP